ncbi:hypothetical protein ASPZODRAFT_126302 [Penicilliopsis zonata CBS 506.65]|uniref:rRNA methyltransferase 2, mitochondrial n=1 Tax=Penicilliopsis zonata CBS 506.65 TaxID=1073090 RepID=A0A1L9STA8_9EURO|nr:hypothetical protein ASPZODRAFT_126302 [Penicilliopsis zonata CBS 506.65]OJJ50440.1 hypothetical protein ASPZODRAFT_126302 [Penicilliopsis zonata CBS 506.65]
MTRIMFYFFRPKKLSPRPFITARQSSSSSSSKRWQSRQLKDQFTREATVQGLKSRAAFKLLQIDEKYRIFRSGQTVVDLGYAPGSWSQVALNRTQPGGRVLGVDIIPAQPPKGVSTIQGNFLSPEIQTYVREFLRDPDRGRPRNSNLVRESHQAELDQQDQIQKMDAYFDDYGVPKDTYNLSTMDSEIERTVDVVLSDMSAPWLQTTGFWKRSLSDPYHRMMNTTGVSFKDHTGSMDLCQAALEFSFQTLKTGGHFICKFYQGIEDKPFELQLKQSFAKVYRLKPKSSRSESKEAYFIGLNRKKESL